MEEQLRYDYQITKWQFFDEVHLRNLVPCAGVSLRDVYNHGVFVDSFVYF